MTMSDVFGERPEERVVQPGDGLAERPETRPVINLASGVRWERLTHDQRSRRRVPLRRLSGRSRVVPRGRADDARRQGVRIRDERNARSAGRLRGVRARARRVDRVRLVVAAPAVGDRRRAGPRGLGRHRPRGRSADDDRCRPRRRLRPRRSPSPAGGGRHRPGSYAGGRGARGSGRARAPAGSARRW